MIRGTRLQVEACLEGTLSSASRVWVARWVCPPGLELERALRRAAYRYRGAVRWLLTRADAHAVAVRLVAKSDTGENVELEAHWLTRDEKGRRPEHG